ncbi:MAG: hypothetical protein OHK93_004455 [Ramalina farinacea]|uniref:Uncharacterized protein n=1 Tax=Ramalina farinacea TaxID=258253 RepID=A0AA43QU55_9LECA|nr:hypothetical protein [Ramalina farinacea]
MEEDVLSRFGCRWPDHREEEDEAPSPPTYLQTLSNTNYAKHHSFMSLLAVNHQLRAEAAYILLAKNQFRFRIASSDDATATDYPFWQTHLQQAKHLTLYFRYTDTPASRIALTAHQNRWSDMGLGGNFHSGIRNLSRLSRRDLWTQRFRQLSRCSAALSSITVNIQHILPPNQPDLPDPTRRNTLFELGDCLWYFITATWQVDSVTLGDSTSYPPDEKMGLAAKTEHWLSCAGVGNVRRSIEIVARCNNDFERLVSGWNVEGLDEDVKEGEEVVDVVMGNSSW